jgi:hypothetical protein
MPNPSAFMRRKRRGNWQKTRRISAFLRVFRVRFPRPQAAADETRGAHLHAGLKKAGCGFVLSPPSPQQGWGTKETKADLQIEVFLGGLPHLLLTAGALKGRGNI